MERRNKQRMDVQLTCYLDGGKVQAAPIRALTRNVSRDGMLMRWVKGIPLPSLEGKLILDVQLPENSEFGPRVMRCETEVVRITPCKGDNHDVALRVRGVRFIRSRRRTMPELSTMPVHGNRVI